MLKLQGDDHEDVIVTVLPDTT